MSFYLCYGGEKQIYVKIWWQDILEKSTFLPPAHVDNLSDAEKLFEEWIHSHDSNDIRRPPKNRNQMLLDAHLWHQEEEDKTVENGFNVEVNNLMEINNISGI